MDSSPNNKAEVGCPPRISTTLRYCLIILLLLMVLAAGVWLNHQTSSLGSHNAALFESLSYLEDEDANLQANEVAAQPSAFTHTSDESLNFGLTSSAYWFWITVTRPSDDISSVMVELGYPHLDKLDVYQIRNDTAQLRYELGDSVPFNRRPVKDRTFVIPVEFHNSQMQADVLLRVETKGSVQLPVSVRTQPDYHLHDRAEQLVLGIYYGILLGILAYNLMLAFGLRDPVYANYCGYVACLLLFQFSLNGLAYEHLWPESAYLQQISTPMCAALTMLFGARFTYLFLNINRQNTPRIFLGYRTMEVFFLALAIASPFASTVVLVPMLSSSITVAVTFMFFTVLRVYLQGDKNANFYLLAWGILIIGVVLYSTKTLGLIPETFVTEYAVQIGSAVEMILLSYALADRFNRLRDENTRLNEQAKATLERHVEHRTRELNDTLEQLKNANSQLESINQRDPLTDLYNRRYFNELLETTWRNMAGSSRALSLIMIDIDHFKAINDTKGHLVGDEVIMKVASLIAEHLEKAQGIPARFGGEEFVVLLPDSEQAAALRIAEEMRQKVAELTFSIPASDDSNTLAANDESQQEPRAVFSTTISLGIATTTADSPRALTTLNIIDQADQALYEAKQSGRNQCRVFKPTGIQIDKAA